MKDLACQLSDATAAALTSLTSDPSYAMVKPADRRDLADFQCNGALALAKSLKRTPQEIAAAMADRWAASLCPASFSG
jgi:arginyl-tRNA synthetase